MSYALSGKIIGYRRGAFGYAGLGDAAYDAALQAYNVDHTQWAIDKQAYDQAMAAWQQQASAAANAYTQAMQIYQMNMAQWQVEAAQYPGLQSAYENQLRTNQMVYGISQNSVLAQYPAIVIPAGYSGCVTQAQHDAWQKSCDAQRSVKGLGAVPTGPDCGLALLPVCAAPIPAPPPLRAKPIAPATPNPPLPPAPIRPEPQPPTPPPVTVTPAPTPTPVPTPPSVLTPSYTVPDPLPVPPPSTTPTQAKTASAGLLSNGLLLVVLVGSSYALYRTFKKPKKAA